MQSRDYLSPVLITILVALLLLWLTPVLAAGGGGDCHHGQSDRRTGLVLIETQNTRPHCSNSRQEGRKKK